MEIIPGCGACGKPCQRCHHEPGNDFGLSTVSDQWLRSYCFADAAGGDSASGSEA